MQEYYLTQMEKEKQEAYRGILSGLLQLAPEFPVRRLSARELSDVFFRLRLDHPEIFYVSGFTFRYSDGSEYVRFRPEYMFEKKKIREHQKALESRISRLLRQAPKGSGEEKELFLHHFICKNVTYDKLKKQYSHEIIGPLQQGIGVCEGIAKTVKLLLDRLGIESVIAVSEADPNQGIRYRHAWNLIRLDGAWYHLDATFDNSLGRCGTERFDYFNLDDRQIFKDHQPLVYPVPACTDGNRFYYKTQRLSLTKIEDLGKRLKAVLRKKEPYFVFHWRGGSLNREIVTALYQEAKQAAAQRGLSARLSLNKAQAVFQVALGREAEGICLEDANEGEAQADLLTSPKAPPDSDPIP